LKAKGIDVVRIAERVADIMGMAPEVVWASGKQPQIVQARSLLCYWATSELGIRQAWLSRKLGISQAAVSLSVSRGRRIALENHYEIGNL
jgi:putative transposase